MVFFDDSLLDEDWVFDAAKKLERKQKRRRVRRDIPWEIVRVLSRYDHDSGRYAELLALVRWGDAESPALERRVWKLDGNGEVERPLKLRPLRRQDLKVIEQHLKSIYELMGTDPRARKGE